MKNFLLIIFLIPFIFLIACGNDDEKKEEEGSKPAQVEIIEN